MTAAGRKRAACDQSETSVIFMLCDEWPCRHGAMLLPTANSRWGELMPYHLEGRLLEVCDCRVLCPCWIGEDPDNGTCNSMQAWHVAAMEWDRNMTGRTVGAAFHIPGNVLRGDFRAALYIDDGASDEQHQALLDLYGGKLGGPVAELAKLVGEVVSVERVPITFP